MRNAVLVHFYTMMNAPHIYELLEARRKDLGLSQAEVGMRAFGKADNTPLQNLKKGSSPSVERIEALAKALGLEFYLGAPRETGPIEIAEIDGEQFAPIRRFDAELSAGNGAENGNVHVSEILAFRRDWLTRLHVSPSNACLVKVRGESMQPTLHDGDLVLIDQSKTKIRSGRIYAFNDGGHSKVKRLDCMDDHTLIIRSDNPQFPLDIRKGEDANALKVIGEVVWSGHTFS